MSRLAAPALALLVLLAAGGAAGCGAGAGDTPTAVSLTVTDDFGERRLLSATAPEVGGGDTVLRLLQRNAKVGTRYGGGFVQAIDGVRGGREGGRPLDWFFYVNGILADKGSAAVRLSPGDRVWWDRRDWGHAMKVPAVVGSFPEPFVSGRGGDRLPTRLECDDAAEAACGVVQKRLIDLGLTVGRSRTGTGGGVESLRVVVGTWASIREDRALPALERGPRSSGVFARIPADGRTITGLDARGRPARTLGPGTGLVAATRYDIEEPTWVVTGTDAAGVDAAAAAFDERTLRDRFAVAVSGGRALGLPLDEEPAP